MPFVEQGDVNGKTLVDGAGIQGFVDVVIGVAASPVAACSADKDVNVAADEGDIGPFVAVLLTS